MRWFALALVLMCTPALAPAPAHAQLEEQASRQIELARGDLKAGNYERAINSASSALRLNPLLYEGLVIKGLAYEQLNETMLAYSLLVTYQELTRGMTQNPEVELALGRLRKLIGAVAASMDEQAAVQAAARTESAGAPKTVAAVESQPLVEFEIISRRNQEDLFEAMNQAVESGPLYVRFRSQSRSKGDDFYFGLGEVRWDRGEVDIDEQVFTLILDSDKLVMKARSGAKIPFPEADTEHDVQVWYDGTLMAVRVDGEAFGPFETRGGSSRAQWFLAMQDDARAWDLEAWEWAGTLGEGAVPTGLSGRSFESTALVPTAYPMENVLRDGDRLQGLPSTGDALQVAVVFDVTCREKSYVLVRIDDGREVVVGVDVVVRGAAKMPKQPGGLACRGDKEHVEVSFAGDGAVSVSIDGRAFSPRYPGRRPGEDPELRVKGDGAQVSSLVYTISKRAKGRRVFRAEKPE